MEFNIKLFFEALEQISEHNFLPEEEALEIIKESVFKTFHNKFDPDAELEMIVDKQNNIFKIINKNKLVVKDEDFNSDYNSIEIPLSKATKIDPNIKVDDHIEDEIDLALFAKNISSQVRQLITQQVREKKKEAIYAKHKSIKGEMIEATVTSSTKSYVIFKLEDGTTAFMPSKLRNLSIPLNIGEKVKVFVEDVLKESKDSQIVVSNGSPTMIKRLLEAEVPEIQEGIVEIVNISRIAGVRSKVSVRSMSHDVDAVGAIIGNRGSRINAVVKKLDGERIDVINYDANINKYVANALAPAKAVSVNDVTNENGEIIEGKKIVVTPNRHQTLAIGKMGSNVKLTVELTKTRLDVISIDEAKEKGIEILWNGNLTEAELIEVEQGNKIARKKPTTGKLQVSDIDIDMSDFTERIVQQEETEEKEEFTMEDGIFTEEELKQMEENFEIDDELANFDINEEDYITSLEEDDN